MIGALSVVIIGVLLAVAVFLISNTISVAASFRRRENEIMRFIGATNYIDTGAFCGGRGAVRRLWGGNPLDWDVFPVSESGYLCK